MADVIRDDFHGYVSPREKLLVYVNRTSGKRAVVFVDYEAKEDKVPYLLDEFTYMWETPFSQTDPAFPCDRQRPPDKEGMDDKLYIANHNLGVEFNIGMQSGILVPNIVQINQTNAEEGFGSLGLHAETCKSESKPISVFLDYAT